MTALNLTAARKKAGLTASEVANAVGVSVAAVSQWEAGKRRPSLEKIVSLAKVLRVTPNDLLGVTGKEAV